MVTTRREFLKSTSVACLATAASTPLLNSKLAAQVSSPVPVKMVQTPVLNIGYEEHGPEDGFPIILLHGFPYDVRSFDGVPPPLVAAG
ncbi:MAG TPA: alpha/beta hydrolase, partial [Gammaproteobacteria bacterium]|nr:alpha/beta hydrolase [Gammaproteobacteria bacterium]